METTADDETAVRAGLDVLRASGRLGALLMQFPFSNTPENLARLETLLETFRDCPLVLEVRHCSWNDSKIHEILRHGKVGLVNIDQPLIGRAVGPSETATSRIAYFRLYGRRYDTWFTDVTPLCRATNAITISTRKKS